jgi:hypothetical protein
MVKPGSVVVSCSANTYVQHMHNIDILCIYIYIYDFYKKFFSLRREVESEWLNTYMGRQRVSAQEQCEKLVQPFTVEMEFAIER